MEEQNTARTPSKNATTETSEPLNIKQTNESNESEVKTPIDTKAEEEKITEVQPQMKQESDDPPTQSAETANLEKH